MRELRRVGHQVTCVFRASCTAEYQELRGWRVSQTVKEGEAAFGLSFGDPAFLELLGSRPWDALCHHAADVTNYRSLDFDPVQALAANTLNLRPVLRALQDSGGTRVVLTGSVFEGGEGTGSQGLPHILPYGLSKALTAQVFGYETALAGLSMGKFVIPNPFGPKQEPRFVQYLMGRWRQGQAAQVSTPDYVRDNIPVDLLARDYRQFLESGEPRRNPSGIVGDQGSFAHLVAREMRARLGWKCELELARQTEFHEPLIRINTDSAAPRHPDWNSAAVWDELAEDVD